MAELGKGGGVPEERRAEGRRVLPHLLRHEGHPGGETRPRQVERRRGGARIIGEAAATATAPGLLKK